MSFLFQHLQLYPCICLPSFLNTFSSFKWNQTCQFNKIKFDAKPPNVFNLVFETLRAWTHTEKIDNSWDRFPQFIWSIYADDLSKIFQCVLKGDDGVNRCNAMWLCFDLLGQFRFYLVISLSQALSNGPLGPHVPAWAYHMAMLGAAWWPWPPFAGQTLGHSLPTCPLPPHAAGLRS